MSILRRLWSIASVVLHLPHMPRGFRVPRYIHAIALTVFILGVFLVWYILKNTAPGEERPPIGFILFPILLPAIVYYFGLHFLTPLYRVRRPEPNRSLELRDYNDRQG
jgi:hypothetical protein